VRVDDEKLQQIAAGDLGQESPEALLRDLAADLREAREALRAAPTQEQLHALVAQLKEVRGENSQLRALLQAKGAR
jgi:hypothetical protein